MSRYTPAELRRKVAQRADFRCEYCRFPEIAAMVKFQLEHIISLKHGGKTILENLAYAFNRLERALERLELIDAGVYP